MILLSEHHARTRRSVRTRPQAAPFEFAHKPLGFLVAALWVACGTPAADPPAPVPVTATTPAPPPPPPPETTVLDLGTKAIDERAVTPLFEVETTSDHTSLQLVAIAERSDVYVQIDNLKNPASTVLAQGQDHTQHLNRSTPNEGVQSTLIPQSADNAGLFLPGKYTFGVTAFFADTSGNATAAEGENVHVFAVLKRKPATNAQHTLDINLYLTGSAGLTAATAPTQARLQQAISELKTLNAQAKITIGQITYTDLPTGFDQIEGSTPSSGSTSKSMAELFRQATRTNKALNFFFVEYLDPIPGSGLAGAVLGVAGGIPGPGLHGATDRSGVVVLFDTATYSAPMGAPQEDVLGVVMAHEGAHFLGLFHTYELSNQMPDPNDNISDTPERDTSGAEDFLMQPTANPAGGVISALQAQTLTRNPVVFTKAAR